MAAMDGGPGKQKVRYKTAEMLVIDMGMPSTKRKQTVMKS